MRCDVYYEALVSCFSETFREPSHLQFADNEVLLLITDSFQGNSKVLINFRFILLISTLVVSAVITCQAKLTIECLVDYLKFRNVNDDAFDSVEAYSGDPGTCSNDVKTKVNEIYGAARSKMELNFKQKPYADCAMKQVEGESYESLILKAEAIELKGVGLKFWKINSKKSKVEDLQKKAQEIVDDALIRCKGQTDYGAFFDSFYEQKRLEPMTDEFEYCMKKHLVDNAVVDPRSYGFKMNPKNLRTENINCVDLMKIAMEQMKASISSAGSTCVINSFINNGYLDLIMKIQLLAKLALTPSERNLERQSFVDSMINMTHKIKSCPI